MADSKYIGQWKAVSVTVGKMTEQIGGNSILFINADGTAHYGEGEDRKDYVWTEKNYGIYLDGKSDMKLTADGDRLTTRLLGFITITFEKLA